MTQPCSGLNCSSNTLSSRLVIEMSALDLPLNWMTNSTISVCLSTA